MSNRNLRFLAVALAAAGLLAFPQPAAAQGYSDGFEAEQINNWWNECGGQGCPGLSTVQNHTGNRSLYVGLGTTASVIRSLRRDFGENTVYGDFSVWIYDHPQFATEVWQTLEVWDASARLVLVRPDSTGSYYEAAFQYTEDPTATSKCTLSVRPSSPEWRRFQIVVRESQVVVRLYKDGVTSPLGECAVSNLNAFRAKYVGLHVGKATTVAALPDAYFDDFCYAPPGEQCPCYTVALLCDALKAVKSGSTIPIKLQIFQGGVNVSSPSLVVHAVSVLKIDNTASTEVSWDDAGNANPDFDFRYDPTLGGAPGGYIFNLKTTGLTTGTYHLKFTVNGLGDYTAPFDVK